MKKKLGFSREEIKAVSGLSSVIALRMLGLTLIIPVFSVYTLNLPGSTVFLTGLAFGVYGLTQALLQIPFGYISDRLGRKPVVITGLLIFGLGSVMAAMTNDIYILILARFLQGAGAIASACFAWIADLTQPSRRNTAMAFMGISIGGAVMLGMITGPIIGGAFGVPFLFWVAAVFSAVAIIIIATVLKEPAKEEHDPESDFGLNPFQILKIAGSPDLIKLDIAGFLMNAGMIVTFFTVPLRLSESFAMSELWKVYIPLSLLGGTAMMFFSSKADHESPRKVISLMFAALCIAFGILSMAEGVWPVLVGFAIFFAAFSVLEATLPAAVSKLADPKHKGSVIGAYNFSQFMGTFIGGVSAGWLSGSKSSFMFIGLALGAIVVSALIIGADGIRRHTEDAQELKSVTSTVK